MLRNVKVGDKLWCVWGQRREAEEVVVTKVGSKWITFGTYGSNRADFYGRIDGGRYSSPASLWLSKEAYEEEKRLTALWSDFSRKVPYTKVRLTEEKIRELAGLLGINLEV